MKLRAILTFILVVAFLVAKADEQPDTLMTCSKAEKMNIKSDRNTLSIVIKNLDGNGENFYYDSDGLSPQNFTSAEITMRNPNDVTVIESEKGVILEFSDTTGVKQQYTFLPDKSSDRTIISYTGLRKDFGLELHQSGELILSLSSQGLGLGFATPVSSNYDMNISMGRSLEVNWLSILSIAVNYGRHRMTAGLGIQELLLETRGDSYFEKNPDRTITMTPFKENQTDRSSKFQFFSLQVPLLYKYRFGHKNDWHVDVGPIVNFNTGGHISTNWREGDKRYTVRTGKLGLRPVTLDGFLAFGWQGLSIYARYAPMQRLKDYTGMKFGTFSTGIIVFL